MKLLYKCRCMATEAEIEVPARTDAVDVVDWLENIVAHRISADHRARSPDCMATKMDYVKIPMPENAPFLGGKPKMDG